MTYLIWHGVEAGKMDLRPEKFSVRLAVESVCAGAKTVALKRKIHVDVAVSPEIGVTPRFLRNLIGNKPGSFPKSL